MRMNEEVWQSWEITYSISYPSMKQRTLSWKWFYKLDIIFTQVTEFVQAGNKSRFFRFSCFVRFMKFQIKINVYLNVLLLPLIFHIHHRHSAWYLFSILPSVTFPVTFAFFALTFCCVEFDTAPKGMQFDAQKYSLDCDSMVKFMLARVSFDELFLFWSIWNWIKSLVVDNFHLLGAGIFGKMKIMRGRSSRLVFGVHFKTFL